MLVMALFFRLCVGVCWARKPYPASGVNGLVLTGDKGLFRASAAPLPSFLRRVFSVVFTMGASNFTE